MKTIEFEIFELSDIKRIIKNNIDKVLFLFKRPKYKIGQVVNVNRLIQHSTVIGIKKDTKRGIFFYKFKSKYCNKEDIWFSEGLLDFNNSK
jgi:hypothetical protein